MPYQNPITMVGMDFFDLKNRLMPSKVEQLH
jgi:hypothetical protein